MLRSCFIALLTIIISPAIVVITTMLLTIVIAPLIAAMSSIETTTTALIAPSTSRAHMLWWTWLDFLRLFQLTLLVMNEIVKDRGGVLERMYDLQHLLPFGIRHFLYVTRMGHRFVFIVLQTNVAQMRIGHVLNVHPFHLELTLPLVLVPYARHRVVVNGRHHLGNATEMSRTVDREEQVNETCVVFALAESLIQTLISVIGGTPNLVFYAPMDVIFRIGFYYEESEKSQRERERQN